MSDCAFSVALGGVTGGLSVSLELVMVAVRAWCVVSGVGCKMGWIVMGRLGEPRGVSLKDQEQRAKGCFVKIVGGKGVLRERWWMW